MGVRSLCKSKKKIGNSVQAVYRMEIKYYLCNWIWVYKRVLSSTLGINSLAFAVFSIILRRLSCRKIIKDGRINVCDSVVPLYIDDNVHVL